MKHLRFKRIGDLSIRGKMTLIVLGILMLTLAGVSVTVSHFSSRYYTGLQQQYNEHVMKEVSYQLNACYQNTEELYLTFNSQKPFSEETTDGTTVFQSVYKQIQFENSVLNVVNANNLQSLIVGTLFWLNDDCTVTSEKKTTWSGALILQKPTGTGNSFSRAASGCSTVL